MQGTFSSRSRVPERKEKKFQRRTLMGLCAQSCRTPGDPMDCSPPGSSVHGIFQARMLEWVAISFSRGSSSKDQTWIACYSCIGRRILSHCTTWEASGMGLANVKCPYPPEKWSSGIGRSRLCPISASRGVRDCDWLSHWITWLETGSKVWKEEVGGFWTDRKKNNRCLLQSSLESALHKNPHCSLENSGLIFELRGKKSLWQIIFSLCLPIGLFKGDSVSLLFVSLPKWRWVVKVSTPPQSLQPDPDKQAWVPPSAQEAS